MEKKLMHCRHCNLELIRSINQSQAACLSCTAKRKKKYLHEYHLKFGLVDPEVKRRHFSDAMKRRWANPEFRKKMTEYLRSHPRRHWLGKKRRNLKHKSGYKHSIPRTEAFREQARLRWKLNPPKQKKFNTRLEHQFMLALFLRGIHFERQVPLCNVCVADFYIPQYRTVIQVDGDYWHLLPKMIKKDKRQNRVLRASGYRVYRFWGHEIDKSPVECVDRMTFQKFLPQPVPVFASNLSQSSGMSVSSF